MSEPEFWDRQQQAQATVEKLKALKKVIDPWNYAFKSASDLKELLGLLDSSQPEALKEMQDEVLLIEKAVNDLEFKRLLSQPLDKNNAIFSINAGAGGTESCD